MTLLMLRPAVGAPGDEERFIAANAALITDGPHERAWTSWTALRARWRKLPPVVQIAVMLGILALPAVCMYVLQNAMTAPFAEQRFVLGYFAAMVFVCGLLWTASDHAVTPWTALQLGVFGGRF